jgi:hypothetical protein
MTNIIKVLYKPKQITTHSRPHLDIGVGVLMSITELWQEQDMENKIKLCYVVGECSSPLISAYFQQTSSPTMYNSRNMHWSRATGHNM